MQTLIFISTLLSFSNIAYADVIGCGPRPTPIKNPVDTATENTAEEDTAEEDTAEEEEETASNRVNRMDLALLFLPVIGLTVASRRK